MSAPVPPQLIRQHIDDCAKRWADQELRTRELEKSMTEASLRMENGVHAFADLREQQNQTAQGFAEKVAELTPKPPSTAKVAGLVLGVIGMAAGALWGLSSMLNDRPTTEQIGNIIDAHHSNGHKDTRDELSDLHDTQIVHGLKLKVIGDSVTAQELKLDTVILQTAPPVKPKPRRNRNR
jgi:hypothetical protein